jgi:hypothetical protein
MNYMGIDHHRQYLYMTLMDEEGRVFRAGRVANLRCEIGKFLQEAVKMPIPVKAQK